MTASQDTETADLQRLIREAFDLALNGERDPMIGKLADIAAWGVEGVHVAICGWSAVVLMCMTGDDKPDPDGFYALEVTSELTGRQCSADELPSPALRAAIQMVSLYGNGDFDTGVALAQAHWRRDLAAGLMLSSVMMAADCTRAHLEQHAEDCTGCGEC